MKALILAATILMASASPALACPVCFGAPDSPQVKGMQMGILALLSVTVVVLGAFAAFFLHLRRRQKLYGGSY
jgi:heme/copper-type cytochrome/quinol oxidase subunit 2